MKAPVQLICANKDGFFFFKRLAGKRFEEQMPERDSAMKNER
jgi:hypothetical protein